MLFIPERLLRTESYDFSKTYNQTSCPPNVANMLTEAGMMRDMFSSSCDAISQKDQKEIVEGFPFDAVLGYLNSTPAILEYAVNQANFPLLMQWESAAFPGDMHSVNNDNEVAATTELILSRMLAAWGASFSQRGHIHALRNAISNSDKTQAMTITTTLKDRTMWSAVRLFKLNYSANLLYQGLKNNAGPVECTKEYSIASYMLLELNLSSVMIERQMAQPVLQPDHLKFITNICLIA
jgi:hypothetical protein